MSHPVTQGLLTTSLLVPRLFKDFLDIAVGFSSSVLYSRDKVTKDR